MKNKYNNLIGKWIIISLSLLFINSTGLKTSAQADEVNSSNNSAHNESSSSTIVKLNPSRTSSSSSGSSIVKLNPSNASSSSSSSTIVKLNPSAAANSSSNSSKVQSRVAVSSVPSTKKGQASSDVGSSNVVSIDSSSQNALMNNTENNNNTDTPSAVEENKDISKDNTIKDKKESSEVASAETTEENKPVADTDEAEEKPKKPEDLPEIDSSEIAFPEVISPASAQEDNSSGYIAGIIAWGCILVGIAIVIFVMVKGKSSKDVPVQSISSPIKRKKRKNKHLLPDKYYKDKF